MVPGRTGWTPEGVQQGKFCRAQAPYNTRGGTEMNFSAPQPIHTPQTSRNGAAELIVEEGPDATARGASVVVVWCAAMIHVCVCV